MKPHLKPNFTPDTPFNDVLLSDLNLLSWEKKVDFLASKIYYAENEDQQIEICKKYEIKLTKYG